jgi:hypothetical protein
MEKQIKFNPAYDKRHSDPSKNYGIHGVTLRFHLIGELGAVQFVLYTNWQLPHVTKEQSTKLNPISGDLHWLCRPMPADLGYHSPKPMYDDHTTMDGPCDLLGGKPCYYDGSGLNAEPIYETLLREGDEGVWKALEDYYVSRFGELK